MVESPRRLDLRLTIPAVTPFRELAAELVAKFAEYAGAKAAAAKTLARDLETTIGGMAADTAVDVEVSAQDQELVVTTTAGNTTRRTTCPLPD
jgi:hypothetical protein